ncbi:ATP sulfurylase 4, chloroplastic [Frankliniella fusca]|uniref:ATP sulfurylase 4, chloroplastic n=1 Tax=Frankliniella fusca TaxID=407009 RepID=A0AAE1L7B0_9NEOP|nr:ATP sulfurylase 4, chloroplastic [Frankliniella fusca]
MLISSILLVLLFSREAALSDIGCPYLLLLTSPLTGQPRPGCLTIDTFPYENIVSCNGSFKFGPVNQDEDKHFIVNYRIFKDSDWTTYDYHICEFSNDYIDECGNSISGCLLNSVECIKHPKESHINRTKDIEQLYHTSPPTDHKYLHFVVARNSGSVLKSCILYFPYQDDSNATQQDIKVGSTSGPLNPNSNPKHFLIIISIILSVIICICVCIIYFCPIQRIKQPDNDTGSIGLPKLKSTKNESPILFIYDSNRKSFKDIVFLVQNVIESTDKLKVINPCLELDSVASYNPNLWLQSHTSVETKYVLFLNQQLMKYLQNPNSVTRTHEDPLTLLLQTFFSDFLFRLSDDQVINIRSMDEETIRNQEMDLKGLCAQYLAEQAEII